jgi:RNA polymerase sigma-70 factor, ECF subfamily
VSHKDRDSRFQGLYKGYYRSVFAYLVRLGFSRTDAEDLAQEAFVRVYHGMDQYRGDAEWTFLQTTARNVASNEIRRRKTKMRSGVQVPLEKLPSLPESLARNPWTGQAQASPEEDVVRKEEEEEEDRRRRRLRAAIEELPQGIRSCLLLRLRGFKYRQIQKILSISMDAVKSRLHEARERLRILLGEEPEGINWPTASASEEDDHDQ